MPDALTGTPRILNAISPSCTINNIGGTYTVTMGSSARGWEFIPSNDGAETVAIYRGYIDLGGLEREALTFFLQSAQAVNNQGYTTFTFGDTIADVMDVFSKISLTDADINQPRYFETEIYSPGYLDSVQDMDQVLWARHTELYHDNGWSSTQLLMPSNQTIWGEGIGTSAGRIYFTRIVNLPAETVNFKIPQCCWQIVGTAVEEPDLEYIMRLRRDYELAQ